MPKRITAKCQKCGNEVEVEWALGMKCPTCGSEKFFPVVRIEEAAVAGRQVRKGGGLVLSQKPVQLLLAAVLFVAAITVLFLRVRSISKPKEFYRPAVMVCTNPNCENLFRIDLVTSNVFPKMTCPKCKQKTAFRAAQCRNCGTIIGLDPDRKPAPTVGLACPKCEAQDFNFHLSTIPGEQGEN